MHVSKAFFNSVVIQNLGLRSYNAAMVTMKSIVQQKINQKGAKEDDYMLLCQHSPVYTVGIRTKDYMDEGVIEKLRSLNADYVYADRGGLITFHGPGQLVCYPILNLKNYNLSLRCYIHKLEEVVMETCRHFDVTTQRTSDIGLWIGDNKIAAIGVHCQRHVTSHGLALNCNTDLSWFSHIVPCGLHGKSVTSLTREIERDVSVEETIPVLLANFKEVFKCDFVNEWKYL